MKRSALYSLYPLALAAALSLSWAAGSAAGALPQQMPEEQLRARTSDESIDYLLTCIGEAAQAFRKLQGSLSQHPVLAGIAPSVPLVQESLLLPPVQGHQLLGRIHFLSCLSLIDLPPPVRA